MLAKLINTASDSTIDLYTECAKKYVKILCSLANESILYIYVYIYMYDLYCTYRLSIVVSFF